MPEIDSVTGILSMPWWIAAAIAACIVLLCLMAFARNGIGRTLAGFAGFVAIALVLGFAWTSYERMTMRERVDERRALDARLGELTLRIAGTPLACLAASAGDVVDAACEKALFAAPETVAAAVAYADARLVLLTDAADYAARGSDYEQALAVLRRPVEADRFGIYAHVFSMRENCPAAETCDAAELVLQNPARIVANLKENTFQTHVTRHAAAWGHPAGPALAGAPAAPAVPAAPPAISSANFPGADSIPPVSIMNNEPGMAGQNGVDTPAKPETAKPTQQTRRPAAKPRTTEPAAPAGSPGFPVPIAPPRPATASSGAATSSQ